MRLKWFLFSGIVVTFLLFGCRNHDNENKIVLRHPQEIFFCWNQSWDVGNWNDLQSLAYDGRYLPIGPIMKEGQRIDRDVIWARCEKCNSIRVIDYDGKRERFISSFENSLKKCETHKWEPELKSWAVEPIEVDDYVCIIFDNSMYLIWMKDIIWGDIQKIVYRSTMLTEKGNFCKDIKLNNLKWAEKSSYTGEVILGLQKICIFPYTIYLETAEHSYGTIIYDCIYGGKPLYNEYFKSGEPRHIAIIHKKDIDANMIIDLTKFRFKTWEDGLGNRCDQKK